MIMYKKSCTSDAFNYASNGYEMNDFSILYVVICQALC